MRLYNKSVKATSRKPQKVMRMNMFAVWDKEKPYIENMRGLNLAEVSLRTVQVTKLPL
jgi:hypothetical protein